MLESDFSLPGRFLRAAMRPAGPEPVQTAASAFGYGWILTCTSFRNFTGTPSRVAGL